MLPIKARVGGFEFFAETLDAILGDNLRAMTTNAHTFAVTLKVDGIAVVIGRWHFIDAEMLTFPRDFDENDALVRFCDANDAQILELLDESRLDVLFEHCKNLRIGDFSRVPSATFVSHIVFEDRLARSDFVFNDSVFVLDLQH